VSGLEWNIRASGARNPSVVEKVAAVFETYWNSGDFVPYEREQFSGAHRCPGRARPENYAEPRRATAGAVSGAVARTDRAGSSTGPWQTGVYWAKEANADLLAFTLDKTSGYFSPTTRYRDYAISRDLIHWESQSVTRADSETGRRYKEHERIGSSIMLFARLRSDDRAFYFLGPGTYVKHESEMPMAVTWRLAHPLSGDLFASFAAAVA
jgi:hypothetical protein